MRLLDGTRKARVWREFVARLTRRFALPRNRMASAVTRSGHSGFTLLEVLISIILLSIGVLGMLGMQAWALRSNQQARFQGSAVRLSRELAEMMRSNPTISTDSSSAANNPYLIDWSDASINHAGATNCYSGSCTTGLNVATFDIQEWYARVVDELPNPRVVVCFDSTPYDDDGLPVWTCTPSSTPTHDSPVIKIGWTTANTKAGADAIAVSTAGSRPGVIVPVGVRTN